MIGSAFLLMTMKMLSFQPSPSSINKFRRDRSSPSYPHPAFRAYLWQSRNLLRCRRLLEEEPKSATSCSLARDMFRPNVPEGKAVLYQTDTIFLWHCRLMLSFRLLAFKIFASLSIVIIICPHKFARTIPHKLSTCMEPLSVYCSFLKDNGLQVLKIFVVSISQDLHYRSKR
jgi:hypothetical protein